MYVCVCLFLCVLSDDVTLLLLKCTLSAQNDFSTLELSSVSVCVNVCQG